MGAWSRVLLALAAIGALAWLHLDLQPAASQETEAVGPPAGTSAEGRRAWLRERVDGLIDGENGLGDARVGVVVVDPATGNVIYERDADGRYNVASNTKLATASAALSLLGPDFRFRTAFLAEQPGAGGVVDGDLYLRGRGDPMLTKTALAELVDELALAGITRVRGGLVIDNSYFDGEHLPPHFDEQPDEDASFRAPVAALSVDYDSINIVVAPSFTGAGTAIVNVEPPGDYVRVVTSEVQTTKTGRTRVRIDTKPTRRHLELRIAGQIRADDGLERFYRRVDDPIAHAGAVVHHMLKERGIRVGTQRVTSGETPETAVVIADRESAPLAEIVRALGKYSNNYVAEMLLKTIGAELAADGEPATWEHGLDAVRGYLAGRCGLEPGTFRYENGSGLFDSSELSPAQIAAILACAHRDPRVAPDLISSLSSAGVDGTIRRRMTNGAATGRVRAKTGTLATVSALSGFAYAEGRPPLIFSILMSDLPRGWRPRRDARSLQDEIAEAVVVYLRTPR